MAVARVLVVCTANVCRSPMGAALLQHHLNASGADVVVTSAGTRSVDLAVDPQAVVAMSEFGIDIAGHRPRTATRELIDHEGADLVLTMTRAHLRDVATTSRTAFAHTFTLRELHRRANAASLSLPGGLGTRAISDLSGWTLGLGFGRTARDLLGDDQTDDIADPYGLPLDEVRRTATDLDRLTRTLAAAAPWPRRAAAQAD